MEGVRLWRWIAEPSVLGLCLQATVVTSLNLRGGVLPLPGRAFQTLGEADLFGTFPG